MSADIIMDRWKFQIDSAIFTSSKPMKTKMTFTAVLHREAEWFVAECPETGTASQGHSVEEAVDNLREATQLYLAEFPQALPSHPDLRRARCAARR